MGLTNYGFFTRYRHEEQEAQQLGFFPCAPGCRASPSDVKFCTCVCQGLNHGLLLRPRPFQVERPVPVPHGYNPLLSLHQAPEALPDLTPRHIEPKPETERLIFPVARGTGRVAKKLGKLFAKSIGHVSETARNDEILLGLRRQFSQERVDAIVDQAFSVYFSHDPDRPRPELYELYETGIVDKALELFRVRWVTGRPKRR